MSNVTTIIAPLLLGFIQISATNLSEYEIWKQAPAFSLLALLQQLFTLERGLIMLLTVAFVVLLRLYWQQRRQARDREAYYQTILDLATDGIVISQESVIQYVNSRMAELSGYEVAEILGKRSNDFIIPQKQEQLRAWNQQRQETPGHAVQSELVLAHKSGRQIYIEVNGANVTRNGQTLTLGIVRDISERRQAEAELRAAADFLREIIDVVPIPIFVKDRGHRFIIANQAYADHHSVALDAVLNKTAPEFLPPPTAERIERITKEMFATKCDFEGERTAVDSPNQERHLWVRHRMVQLSSGEEVIVGSMIDITERKTLEIELRNVSAD